MTTEMMEIDKKSKGKKKAKVKVFSKKKISTPESVKIERLKSQYDSVSI